MAIIILIICLLLCGKAYRNIKTNSKRAEKWRKTGIDMSSKVEDKDILALLCNIKLPEEKSVRIDEEQHIIIEVNKSSYRIETCENQEGNTNVKLIPVNENGKSMFGGIEITWLYEFLNDEIMRTSNAQKYYKETNSNARRLLFGGIISIICIIIIIMNSKGGEEQRVRNSAPGSYPNVTYEEAFESYFPGYFLKAPSWILLEDEYGFTTLTFKGCISTAAFDETGCEEIEVILDVVDENIWLNDVIIYGDLENPVIPYKRELSPLLDEYVIEFLFEYAEGLEEGEPEDPLSYAFIKMVQGSSFSSYPDSIIGDTFSATFLDHCEWTYFLSDLGKDIVEFKGQIDEETYRMQFVINENCEEFTLDYMEVNGEALSEFEIQIFLAAIFLAG